MDRLKFDALAKRLATGTSRRGALGGLAGSLVAALGVEGLNSLEASAKKQDKKDKKGKKKDCHKGKKLCGKHCADLSNDEKHCGSCHNKCESGQSCVDGSCQCGGERCAGCCDGQTCQNGTSNDACGSGGGICVPCSGGQTCQDNACKCPQGQQLCGSDCTDTKSDAHNCGGCGVTCATGGSCDNGACVCPGDQIVCQGTCIDGKTDADNCGDCGVKCGSGGVCENGTCSVVLVSPHQLSGWSIRDNSPDRTNGPVEFVVGPDTPPLGTGSVQFTTRSGSGINDKSTLQNTTFAHTQITDLTTLKYNTYLISGGTSHNIAPAIKFEITSDLIEGGTTATLIFEPVYFGAAESVEEGEWQAWDALDAQAKWWCTKNVPDPNNPGQYLVCNPNNPPPGCQNQFIPWSQILAALPDAAIDTLLLETGSGTPNAVGSVDKLQINSTTYDFEPEP